MFWSLRPTGRMPWIIREVKHHVYVKRQTPFCATCPSPLFTCRLLFPISQWYIQGRGRGAGPPPPPLFLEQNEAQRAKNISLRPAPSPPLLISESGWPGSPFSEGLDLPLFLHLNYKVRAIFLSIRVVFSCIYLFIFYFGEILTLNLTFAVCRIREA